MSNLGDYLAAITSCKLVAPFGESSGTSVADTSGNAHTGTAIVAPTWGQASLVPGDATTSALFVAASLHTIQWADHADFDVGTGDWWFHVILKAPANASQFITTKDATDGIDCRFDGGSFSVVDGSGVNALSGPNSTEGWRSGSAFQLVYNAKRSAASGQFYRNGTPSGTAVALTTVENHANSAVLEFGSRLATGNSPLYLDATAGYFAIGTGGALTAGEIADLAEIFANGELGGGGGSPTPTTLITPRSARKMRWRLSG